LKQLSLNSNKINDSEALTPLHSLEFLTLSDNPVFQNKNLEKNIASSIIADNDIDEAKEICEQVTISKTTAYDEIKFSTVDRKGHRLEESLPPEFDIVSVSGISKADGFLGEGGIGIVYTVRDRNTKEILAAKTPQLKKYSVVSLIDKLLIKEWHRLTENDISMTTRGQLALKTMVFGENLHSMLEDGSFFTDRNKIARSNLRCLLCKLIANGYVLKDFHTKNTFR
jgi:hypothetical protein